MPNKTEYYARMAEEAARQVTRSREQWTAFLTTAARLYKYPYPEQLMIFAQRPDATACAEYDLWNDRMNRYVKRGSKGIALVDMSGERPRLRYVFDVSDTGERRNSRPVQLWKVELEHEAAIKNALEDAFEVSSQTTLDGQIMQVAEMLAENYWNEHKGQILDIVEDSYLEEYDEYNIEVSFKRAAATSIAYCVDTRAVGNADDYFDHEDFLDIFDFNTQATANVLGTAVSEMSGQIFREIERTIRNYERAKETERSQEDGRNNERNDIYADRGLSDSGYSVGDAGDEAVGQVWQDEENVSAGEQHNPVQSSDSDREVIPASLGDSGDSDSTNRADDDRTVETESSAGQENRSDGMGSAHEHAENTGRRDRGSGTYNQLNLFSLFPSEQEQINGIDNQVETPVMTAESVKPSAFSISDEEIDRVLHRGSGFAGGKIRIYAMYQQQGDAKARADFLKNEYGTGGHSYTFDDGSHGFVDYDAKQKFISQIMTSKSPVRSCDDVDEQALSYAEIKALCAGDPNIREKMDLDVEVARLKVLKADHQSQQYRLEDQLLKYFPAEIEKQHGFIKGFKEDIQTVETHPVPEEGFVGMEVKGVHYTEKAEAGDAILACCKGFQSMDSVPIGSYRGFQMELSFDSFSKEFQVALKGEMTHRVSIGTSAAGNMTRLDNALASIPQRLEKAEQKLDGLYQQQETAKAEVGKPFPQEAELAEKSARLSELDALLNMDERDNGPELSEGEEKPSVLADLKNRAKNTPPPHEGKEEHKQNEW